MNVIQKAALISVLMAIAGCAVFVPKETRFLRAATDRATQAEVKQQLGSPWRTEVRPTGESVWVYEVREQDPGTRWTSTGLWCDEYVLTFDSQSVLRRWTHTSYFHGGEIMPASCNSVTGVQKPAL